jgi:hypothetical protein
MIASEHGDLVLDSASNLNEFITRGRRWGNAGVEEGSGQGCGDNK